MKLSLKSTIKVMVAVAVALLPLAIANGQGTGLPGSSWWTSFQVQNVSSQGGSLQIQAYPQDNASSQTTYSSGQFSLAAGAGLTYNPGFAPNYSTGGNRIGFCTDVTNCTDTLASGFSGAVVASADVNIVAVASVNNSLNGSVGNSSGHAGGNYAGVSAPATQLLFPVAKHNFGGNTVAYFVQAAGGPATATMTYTMNDGTTHTETASLDANEMHLFDPANASPAVASTSCTPAATSPCLGSAVVVASSGQIAGVALEFPESPASGFAAILGASRGFVPSDYSTTILAPIFKHDFPNATSGNFSGWSLQNTSNVEATVNITFTVSRSFATGVNPGQQYFSQVTVPPNGQTTLSKFRNNIGGMPAGIAASAIATSNQPLVAVANESNSNASATPFLTTYNCFAPSGATGTVAAPLVKEFFPGGISATSKNGTSVTVQNAGDANATVNVIYTVIAPAASAGQVYTVTIGVNQGAGGNTQLLAPGASYVFNMLSDPARASLYAAGTGSSSLPPSTGLNTAVRVVSNQPVIALMQEDNKAPSGTTPNDLTNYEGFNQ